MKLFGWQKCCISNSCTTYNDVMDAFQYWHCVCFLNIHAFPMKNKLINATQTAAFPSPECMTFTAKVKYLTDVFLVIMNANWRWFSFLPSTGVPWKPSSGWLLLWMSFISSGDFYLIWVTFNLIRMTFSTHLYESFSHLDEVKVVMMRYKVILTNILSCPDKKLTWWDELSWPWYNCVMTR